MKGNCYRFAAAFSPCPLIKSLKQGSKHLRNHMIWFLTKPTIDARLS